MLRRLVLSSSKTVSGSSARNVHLYEASYKCSTRYYSGTPGLSPKAKADIVADRDFFVSVLEASATKRDAKGYLQKYASAEKSQKKYQRQQAQQRAVEAAASVGLAQSPHFHQELFLSGNTGNTENALEEDITDEEPLHLALVQIRSPQLMDEKTKEGVAKSLSQLRTLGLLCVVVVDCGPKATNKESRAQCERLGYAINKYRGSGAKVIENILGVDDQIRQSTGPFSADGIYIAYPRELEKALKKSVIPILPALASEPETFRTVEVAPESVMVSLAKYFTKLQFSPTDDFFGGPPVEKPLPATIEKIIILDSNGGLPFSQGSRFAHRFVNLEQEYDNILTDLTKGLEAGTGTLTINGYNENESHIRNLKVVRETLAMLPSTSSALITTPMAAANVCPASQVPQQSRANPSQPFGIAASVRTRKSLNPLIHNLLTDKPIYSSSLPFERISGPSIVAPPHPRARMGTLVKRGTPVTIYPDPSVTPWTPPRPGGPRPRLTDSCIDLGRLAFLIKDSFGRSLDLEEYLKRVENNLAGVIIAGNYEGAAILTWECPTGLTDEDAYAQNRFVPYLDKFAVLRSSQGTGGVADIVFNSMARHCFVGGVCWRSRKNNPVNKWYFERSQGTMKLPGTEWTMFWTTPRLLPGEFVLKDYENICRKIQPTWVDIEEP